MTNRSGGGASASCPFHGGGTGSHPRRITAPAKKTELNGKTTTGKATDGKTPNETAETGGRAETAVRRGGDGVWRVRGYEAARAILRGGDTRQAGFRADDVRRMPAAMRLPVLFLDGEEHRDRRRETARFFAPATVDEKYRGFMTAYADELVDELRRRGQADVSDLSLRLAVQVAARIVGLTDSIRPGMDRRIEAFLRQGHPRTAAGHLWDGLRNQARIMRFFFADVRPAIRARRRHPREDLISHLVEEGYGDMEILTECITFAVAGMVTTREFISVAAWHLLNYPALKETYLTADEGARHAMLHEILRVEPVVGHVLRRAATDVTVHTESGPVTIPAGDLIDIHVYDANADESAVGPDPEAVCPARRRARGVQPYVLSFGDGHHRCPGAYIAIQETDIFLTRLLALDDLEVVQKPAITRQDLVKGYELRRFLVRVPATQAAA